MTRKTVFTAIVILSLGVALVAGSLPAQAGPRGGGRGGAARAKSGSYSKSGSYQRTNRNGKTRSATSQGTGTWTRNRGQRSHQYRGTVTGQNGKSAEVERGTTLKRTGGNTYSKESRQTWTGPEGNSRTRSQEGTGEVNRTDDGWNKSYEGTYTTGKGETYNVSKEADHSRNEDGSRTTERDVTVTNSAGQTVGSGSASTNAVPGQGTTTTGTVTGPSGTRGYEGSTTPGEGGWMHQGTWSNEEGQVVRQGETTWKWVDGRWTKVSSGTNAAGGSVETEVDYQKQ